MLTTAKQKAFIEVCFQHLSKTLFYDEHQRLILEAGLEDVFTAFLDEVDHNILNTGQVEAQKLYLKRVLDDLTGLAPLLALTDGEILEPWLRAAEAVREASAPNLSTDGKVKLSQIQLPEEVQRLLNLRKILKEEGDLDDLFKYLTPVDWLAYQADLGTRVFLNAWIEIGNLYVERGGTVGESPKDYSQSKPVIAPEVITDITTYIPWVLDSPEEYYPTNADVFQEWVRHLASLAWRNYPYTIPWDTPLEYEVAFFNAPDRGAFVIGLQRVLVATNALLALKDDDDRCWLFRNSDSALSEASRKEARSERLVRARQALQRVSEWLRLRQRPVEVQYLDALHRIIVFAVWDEQGRPTNRAAIAHEDSDGTSRRFGFLLEELRKSLPALPGWKEFGLQVSKVNEACSNYLPGLDTIELSITTLEESLPPFCFSFPIQDSATLHSFSDGFKAELAGTLKLRQEWAGKAYRFLQRFFVLPSTTELLEPDSSQMSPGEGSPKLSHRQIALLYWFTGKLINGANKGIVATRFGHTSGDKLMQHYNEVPALINHSEISKRQATHLVKDIKALIPYLDDEQRKQAEEYLRRFSAKIS